MGGFKARNTLAVLTAFLGMTHGRGLLTGPTQETSNQGTCGLPSCGKPANRGGYCSAEHCRTARQLDRKKRGYNR